MKTILDYKDFKRHFEKRCAEQNIDSFYIKATLVNSASFLEKPKVYVDGDIGDEIFDAIYRALEDIGMNPRKMNISPYDFVEMKSIPKTIKKKDGTTETKYGGMSVEFKELPVGFDSYYREDEGYYKNCCTTVSLPMVIDKIRKNQGEEFPVRVRFMYIDSNGNKECKTGVITGVLDNGDEVYIDAETSDYHKGK